MPSVTSIQLSGRWCVVVILPPFHCFPLLSFYPYSPAQRMMSITRQSGHTGTRKGNSLTQWNLSPWNSGVRVTQVHGRAGFWFQSVWTSDTPTGRRSAAAGSGGDERDLSAGAKQTFGPRIGKQAHYENRMGKCKSGASRNPDWESTVMFKHTVSAAHKRPIQPRCFSQ